MAHYGDFQNAIYGAGLRGVVPTLPVDFATLEQRASAALPPAVLSYLQGGCGDEFTQDENARAFRHWGLTPRMMVDCSRRNLSIDLFGMTLPTPLFMAPVGINGICTQDQHGDLAAARASAITGVPLMASTLSNDPLETVAEALGETPGFFQLYTPKDVGVADPAASPAARGSRPRAAAAASARRPCGGVHSATASTPGPDSSSPARSAKQGTPSSVAAGSATATSSRPSVQAIASRWRSRAILPDPPGRGASRQPARTAAHAWAGRPGRKKASSFLKERTKELLPVGVQGSRVP